MEKLLEDERDKLRELLQPIEGVSLTTDTWTTINNMTILGMTIHSIYDTLRLHEKVLTGEELGVSHQGTMLAEVVHCVLEESDLTQKVSNILLLFCNFNLKSININFFLWNFFLSR